MLARTFRTPGLKWPSSARRGTVRRVLLLVGCTLLLPLATRANDPRSDQPLRVVIVGGGPEMAYNQVAIESNVRYLNRLLPADSLRTTLFADGDLNHATVLYDDDPKAQPVGERLVRLLLAGRDGEEPTSSHYRRPNLGGKLDGASRMPDIQRVFGGLQEETGLNPTRPLLLYFTGHGSSDRRGGENNKYDLWGAESGLTVRELAQQINRLPLQTPVTLVMVQCFSGSFGNLILENGDPQADATPRDIAGFFATVKERVAAGCTSAVNEAEYRDFTSYFFAALTGRDRVGRRVTGADYNHDGRVGMDEAFCYTLAHDQSIDVPVCTSDVFLRRFVTMLDTQVMQTPYANLLKWATPAQRAALESLSTSLQLHGEHQLADAYGTLTSGLSASSRRDWRGGDRETEAESHFNTLRKDGRAALLRRFPRLAVKDPAIAQPARRAAAAALTQEAQESRWRDLLDAEDALDKLDASSESEEIAQSRVIRFVRVGKSIVLAHRLRDKGSPELKARFTRLEEAESRTLLPPAAEDVPALSLK